MIVFWVGFQMKIQRKDLNIIKTYGSFKVLMNMEKNIQIIIKKKESFTQPEIKKKYIQEFSDDKKCVSLKNWHEFEKNNPDIFIGMYNFWLRKV